MQAVSLTISFISLESVSDSIKWYPKPSDSSVEDDIDEENSL